MTLPVITFIQTRINEANSSFETREGTAFYSMFVNPQQLMVQPLFDAMDNLLIASSIKNLLAQPNLDTAVDPTQVDNIVSNLYVNRNTGGLATTTVQVFYSTPLSKEFPAGTAQFTATDTSGNTVNFYNSVDIAITAAQMALNVSNALYFFTTAVVAEAAGSNYNVIAGNINGFVNDTEAVLVTNPGAAVDGLPAQTNTQLLTQAATSIGVRDLETTKGINAILQANFSFLTQITAIGAGDPEMQRDILYNVHVLGKTDVYLNSGPLQPATFNAIGLAYDLTRNFQIALQQAVARSLTDPLYTPNLGTPNIVVSTVIVKEAVVETAASIQSVNIPAGVGIDLTGHEWINLTIDSVSYGNIKVSGAVVAQTQLFEIINSINAGVGLAVATQTGSTFKITSPTIGAGSQIVFSAIAAPVLSTSQAATVLFSGITIPWTIDGIVAQVYTETVDYIVDYVNGFLSQTAYPSARSAESYYTLMSGQIIYPAQALSSSPSVATDGQIVQSGGQNYLNSSTSNAFATVPNTLVRVGDVVTITSINGTTSGTVDGVGPLPATFIVSTVVSPTRIQLSGFNPTTGTAANTIKYYIQSSQVVDISYKYNPISIDVGGLVIQADGFTRGIRPGRSASTITNTPLMQITSIQPIDPGTLEPLGNPLNPPQGYGMGGYGLGGYGMGLAGDYQFIVNDSTTRFSMFDDCMIIFNENLLASSVQITYDTSPQIASIHTFCRTDTERVTGADVLPKNLIPVFVDIPISMKRDPNNANMPSDAALLILVENLVSSAKSALGLTAASITQLLEDNGALDVAPLTLTGTVHNPDGSTSILVTNDTLIVPAVTLPSQVANYTTPRITAFYPNNITITDL